MSAHATQQIEATEASTQSAQARPAREDIASLAYGLWQERGCPEGSSEEDWLRAEELLSRLQA
jgi:hypothetical protein